MHFPDAGSSPTFHFSEIRSFYSVVGRYYAKSNRLARAIACYFIIETVD